MQQSSPLSRVTEITKFKSFVSTEITVREKTLKSENHCRKKDRTLAFEILALGET